MVKVLRKSDGLTDAFIRFTNHYCPNSLKNHNFAIKKLKIVCKRLIIN